MKIHSDGWPAAVERVVFRRIRQPEVRRRVIAEMVRMRRSGLTDRQIAATYCCSRETVNRLINARDGEGP